MIKLCKKIYFLILNYKTKNETINCIRSIQKLQENEYKKEIVIIDNCSEDGSFEYLWEIYKNDKSISMYRTEENVGFSKANNYGYQIIRDRKDAKFIVICNSDIEFRQEKFLDILCSEFNQYYFDIGGPDVYCEMDLKKGWEGHQSPAYPWESKKWFVKLQYFYNKIKLGRLTDKKNSVLYFSCAIFENIQNMILRFCMRSIYKNYRLQKHIDIPLHGSCIIVTENFLNLEEKVFSPETKFYGEELLLYLKQRKKGYKSIYIPELKIWHMQGRATGKIDKQIERKKFVYENLKKSAKIYLDEVENFR